VRWAKDAGLETECYFMMGFPGETETDMDRPSNCAGVESNLRQVRHHHDAADTPLERFAPIKDLPSIAHSRRLQVLKRNNGILPPLLSAAGMP